MSIRKWPRTLRRLTNLRTFAAFILASSAIFITPGQKNATAFAQIANETSNTTPVLMSRPETGLRIGVGDMVQVTVFDTPELSSKLRVNADGTVDLPVAGSTPVSGMTPQDAGDAIAKHLKDAQIMIDPRVTVTITDYATQEVSVLGEVKNPGNYLLLGPHSLYNALSAAGGTTEKAGGAIMITHLADPQKLETIHVDSPNYSQQQRLTNITAGDVIYVSRAGSVYVLGDVTHPGEFSMGSKRLTVLEAIALAQGTTVDAALSRAAIIRKTDDGERIIPVDLKRVAKTAEGDEVLTAEDIVVVPHSRGRAFVDATLPALTASAVGSAFAAMILLGH
jgi:polysaccharide export outer membrane protein